MLLQGSISRFDLASVLQFLAQGTSTGVLEVRDFEEFGFIYLVEGRVEGISLPITDEKLGARLVKAGCLTEQQLAQALIELHEDGRRRGVDWAREQIVATLIEPLGIPSASRGIH